MSYNAAGVLFLLLLLLAFFLLFLVIFWVAFEIVSKRESSSQGIKRHKRESSSQGIKNPPPLSTSFVEAYVVKDLQIAMFGRLEGCLLCKEEISFINTPLGGRNIITVKPTWSDESYKGFKRAFYNSLATMNDTRRLMLEGMMRTKNSHSRARGKVGVIDLPFPQNGSLSVMTEEFRVMFHALFEDLCTAAASQAFHNTRAEVILYIPLPSQPVVVHSSLLEALAGPTDNRDYIRAFIDGFVLASAQFSDNRENLVTSLGVQEIRIRCSDDSVFTMASAALSASELFRSTEAGLPQRSRE